MWSNIINNKDLNIPSQKEMLAQFRCNEIKDSSIALVDQQVNEIELESSLKIIPDFKLRVEKIAEIVWKNYDSTAKDYWAHIYQDIRRQLISTFSQKLYSAFANQLKRLIPTYQKEFRMELEKELINNDNFVLCAQLVKKKFLNKLEQDWKNIKAYDSWESGQDNEELFDEIIDNQRLQSIEDKKTEIIKKILDLIDDSLLTRLEEITPEFWIEVNQDVIAHTHNIIFVFKEFLEEYYKMKDEEFTPFMWECEKEIYSVLKTEFMKKQRDITNYAVENFRKFFWYDEGIPRVWNKWSEGYIDELFQRYKKHNYFVFDWFKEFKMWEHPWEIVAYQKVEEGELNKLLNEKVISLVNDNKINGQPWISEAEFKGMKIKYEDSITEFYEDAMRRNRNIKQSSVPLWAWLLWIYVGYSDLWKMLTGYWWIPCIILLALYGVLHMMGWGNVPFMAFNMVKTQISSKWSSGNEK